MDKDTFFMEEALKLAKKRKGLTHPNPTVGAVIVKDGKIIGKGYHERAGKPHAEREAIKDALEKGHDISGSTMYVTLEPCCHYGRTPPCTEAIIDSRIKRVVIATLDPNPQVAGKGVDLLKRQGIQVKTGVLEEEARKLNEDFFIYITQKRPFVHLKIAQSIDGKIATYTGSSKWITGEEARKYAHHLRNEATAVMVGVGTALTDNPSLTVRHIPAEKQPLRVLIDRELKTPTDFNIFDTSAKTIVITSDKADKEKEKILLEKGVKIIKLPLYKERFQIKDILDTLYKEEVVHLLVEGGKGIITQFIKENIFDRISVFIAPKIIGEEGISSIGPLNIKEVNQTVKLKRDTFKTLKEDIFLSFVKQ